MKLMTILTLHLCLLAAENGAAVISRYVPHLAVNEAWKSRLLIANPSPHAVDLSLLVVGANGEETPVLHTLDGSDPETAPVISLTMQPGHLRAIEFLELPDGGRNIALVVTTEAGLDLTSLELNASFFRIHEEKILSTVTVPVVQRLSAGYRFANFTYPEKLTNLDQKSGFAAFNPHAYPIELTIRAYDGTVSHDEAGLTIPARTIHRTIGPGQKYFDLLDHDEKGTFIDAAALMKDGLGCFEFEARTEEGVATPFAFLPLGFIGDVVSSLPMTAFDPDRRHDERGGAFREPTSASLVVPHVKVSAHDPRADSFDAWNANLLIHNPSDRDVEYELSFYNEHGEPQTLWVVHNPYPQRNFQPSTKAATLTLRIGPGETRYALLYTPMSHEVPEDPSTQLVADQEIRHVSVMITTITGDPNPLEISVTHAHYSLATLVSQRRIHTAVSAPARPLDAMSSYYSFSALTGSSALTPAAPMAGVALFNPHDEPIKIQMTLYDHLNRVVAKKLDYGPVPTNDKPIPAKQGPAFKAAGVGILPKLMKVLVLDEAFFGLEPGTFQELLPLGMGRFEFEASDFTSMAARELGVLPLGFLNPEDEPEDRVAFTRPLFEARNAPPLEPAFYSDGGVFDWNPLTLTGGSMNFVTGLANLENGKIQGWGFDNDLLAYPATNDPPYGLGTLYPKDSAVGYDFKKLKGGPWHACGILAGEEGQSDQVLCWGSNGFKQLTGFVRRDGFVEAPLHKATPVDLGGRTPLQLALTQSESCALTLLETEDGPLMEVWCWGLNAPKWSDERRQSRILNSAMASRAYRVALEERSGRILQLVGYGMSVCALFDDGRVQCWGDSVNSHLGHTFGFTADQRPSYVQQGEDRYGYIALGLRNMCGILKFDEADHPLNGLVKCWGSDNLGVLGTTPIDPNRWKPADMPTIDFGGKKALMVALANDSACAVLEDHSIHCWGSNSGRALSVADRLVIFGYPYNHMVEEPFTTPVNLPNRTLYIEGAYNSFCVVDENYDVKCWGDNQRGLQGWECIRTVLGLDCIDVPAFMREDLDPVGKIVHDTHFIGGEWVMEHLERIRFDGKIASPSGPVSTPEK